MLFASQSIDWNTGCWLVAFAWCAISWLLAQLDKQDEMHAAFLFMVTRRYHLERVLSIVTIFISSLPKIIMLLKMIPRYHSVPDCIGVYEVCSIVHYFLSSLGAGSWSFCRQPLSILDGRYNHQHSSCKLTRRYCVITNNVRSLKICCWHCVALCVVPVRKSNKHPLMFSTGENVH